MSTVSRFEDLELWKLARQQANDLWTIYTCGPFAKDFELKNQISRSSGSVMDNIAEGFERSGNKEFVNYLLIAKGSNGEVRSQLHRALDRKYLTTDQQNILMENCMTISRKLTALIKYLKQSSRKGFRYE